MKTFLKKGEVQLINGGYVSDMSGKPVSNTAFLDAQLHAEYIVTFAKMAKNKNFKGVKANSIESFITEVKSAINKNKPTQYLETPTTVKRPTTEKLAAEAMAFMEYQGEVSKVEKINQFLQQFNVINEFETYGLFFDQEIVKLSNIYTMEEITTAVAEVIDLLN